MKLLVDYNESTHELTLSDGRSLGFSTTGVVRPTDEYKEGTNVKELISAGMTAEDLIKLKHGGVI